MLESWEAGKLESFEFLTCVLGLTPLAFILLPLTFNLLP